MVYRGGHEIDGFLLSKRTLVFGELPLGHSVKNVYKWNNGPP